MSTQIVSVPGWGHREWQRMPRSFLVKKPCSHRIPDYGHLLEAQAGLVLSVHQNEDSSIPKPGVTEQCQKQPNPPQIQVDVEQGNYCEKTFLKPLALRMDDALSVLTYELPLKDNMNNLNMPLRSRTMDGGFSTPGNKAPFNLPSTGTAPQISDPVGCLDFQKPGGLYTGSKLWNCRYFSCPHCSKAYSSLGALKMHIRTHTLPCACRICGKAFSRPWLLQGHIRTHTGEKPFSCYHCGRGFADRSNLRAHLQTHSEIKRYQCPGCGKTFSRISLLTKHRNGCCCPVS